MKFNFLPPINWSEQIEVIEEIDCEPTDLKFLIVPSDEEKEDTMMFSLAECSEEHFIKDNITEISGIVLDCDSGSLDFKIACKLLKDYFFTSWTTHSYSKTTPKYRFVIPFSKPVKKKHWFYFTLAFRKETNIMTLAPDESTWQISRRFILPPKDSKIIHWHKPDLLDPTEFIKSGIKMKKIQRALQKVKMESKPKDLRSGKKPKKYFEAWIRKDQDAFYKGNRDNWLTKTIWKMKKKGCCKEWLHDLLDGFIYEMDRNAKRKFLKRIDED